MKPDSRDGASGFHFPNRLVSQDDFPLQERKCQAFPLVSDGSIHRDLMGLVYITGKSTALPQSGTHPSDIPRDGKDGSE